MNPLLEFPAEKRCRICLQVKPVELFNRDNGHSDGRRNECKPCFREYQKRFYKHNPPNNQPVVSAEGRQCRTCGEVKPVDAFYKDPKCADGLKSDCIICARKTSRDFGRRNLERGRLYYQQHKNDPVYRAKRAALKLRERVIFKEKYRARNMIEQLVYRGTLVRKPCEKCGLPNAQAHHEDYSKPLEVRWLCQKHHSELHRKYA